MMEATDLDSGQQEHESNENQATPVAGASRSPSHSPQDSTVAPATSRSIPPTYKSPAPPQMPQPVDNVMRYCKYCGAFLRQGVSYCPKCGRYAKVIPPTYRPQQAVTRNASYQQPVYRQQQPADSRNRVRQPMASKTRTPGKSKVKPRDNKTWDSGIFSIMGCLTFTIIVVAIFFIIYILNGEGALV